MLYLPYFLQKSNIKDDRPIRRDDQLELMFTVHVSVLKYILFSTILSSPRGLTCWISVLEYMQLNVLWSCPSACLFG